METCCRVCGMSTLWGLSIRPTHLWCLIFRVLPRMLGRLPHPSFLLKKLWRLQHAVPPPPPMELELELELETVVGTLPELPQDVLEVILATLEIPDLVRAGSVCSSWRAAYTSLRDLGRYKQSQTPCLLYTSESAGDNVACLYSLAEKRVYRLPLPDPPIRTRILIGSSNGWLVTVDERAELLLLNPFTGEQIALPSVATIEHVKPIVDDSGSIHRFELSYYTGEKVYSPPEIHTRSELREQLYFKAFVFPNSSTGSYIVVLIHHPYYQLSFAQAGDDRWTWLPPDGGYRDCMYMDGVLYALTEVGGIDAFHLTGSAVTREVIVDTVKDYVYESMYIIPAPWGGDLLQVWREVDIPRPEQVRDDPAIFYNPCRGVWRVVHHPSGHEVHNNGDAPVIMSHPEQEDEDGDSPKDEPTAVRYITNRIIVYKVDLAAKELVNINGLPKHILFLGHNQSLCLGAEQHPQLKADHAYFTDDYQELIMGYKEQNVDVNRDTGVLNLGNHRRQKRKEIVSKIWSDWPCPTWIVPHITKMDLAFRN